MNKRHPGLVFLVAMFFVLAAIALPGTKQAKQKSQFLGNAQDNAQQLVAQGQQIFRPAPGASRSLGQCSCYASST